MNPYASPQAYRESSVMTASPAQLVVMLYDGAGRFLRQAELAGEEGAWSHAFDRLDRADAIVDELLVTLDREAGEIAERLMGIYVFCKRLLIEARVERDPGRIRRTAGLLAELRESWAEVAAAA
ncbi:MAG TPA: flagellar export chaperone FliS [Solirubrobacteraceae bacterium]|jgi:flagellar protein FliS|nr:flagellar export chaperone FliS [Solirubrobacteraceae bacterium]